MGHVLFLVYVQVSVNNQEYIIDKLQIFSQT